MHTKILTRAENFPNDNFAGSTSFKHKLIDLHWLDVRICERVFFCFFVSAAVLYGKTRPRLGLEWADSHRFSQNQHRADFPRCSPDNPSSKVHRTALSVVNNRISNNNGSQINRKICLLILAKEPTSTHRTGGVSARNVKNDECPTRCKKSAGFSKERHTTRTRSLRQK